METIEITDAAHEVIEKFKGNDGAQQGKREALRNISDLLMSRITKEQFNGILERQKQSEPRNKDHAAFATAYVEFVEDILNMDA